MAKEHDMVHQGPHKRTHHPRAVGGFVPKEKEVSPDSEEVKKRGGAVKKRKAGGEVKGFEAKMRPDRRHRAAGGGVGADTHPFTSAEKMSRLPYEKAQIPGQGGKGTATEKAND